MNFSYFFVAMALALSALTVQAQTTLNTTPEGVLTLDLPATGTATITTYFSLPLTADPVYSGAISAITANTISVTVDANDPAPFVNPSVGVQLANLAAPGLPYFVKFLSGSQAGRIIKVTANTSSSLTLDTSDNSSQTVSLTTSGFSVAVGDTFSVFPGATLASMFGDNSTANPLVLKGGTSVFVSDTVSIYNPTAARFQAFYFNTSAGFWEMSGTSTNASSTVIYPYEAFTITRRSNEAVLSIVPMALESSMVSSGSQAAVLQNVSVVLSRVADVPVLTKTTGSNVIVYGSANYPVDLTFSQLKLGSNWVRGTSVFNSDTVSIYNSTLFKFETYYQLSSDPTPTTWHKLGSTVDQSNTVIPAGAGISILKRAAVSGGTSFLSSVLPYSLN